MSDELPLLFFTIYERPRDYPDEFVVRRSTVDSAGLRADEQLHGRGATIDQVRATLPEFCYEMPVNRYDDPCIIEVWLHVGGASE